jgi:hypothetical protein
MGNEKPVARFLQVNCSKTEFRSQEEESNPLLADTPTRRTADTFLLNSCNA